MTRSHTPRKTGPGWDMQHESLVQDIYECALHPDGWNRTLTHIRQYLNASAINLIGLEVASHDNPFLYTSNIPADYGKAYQQYWFHEDPWVQAARARQLNRGGETVAGGMLVENRELKRGAFYHDWLADRTSRTCCSPICGARTLLGTRSRPSAHRALLHARAQGRGVR